MRHSALRHVPVRRPVLGAPHPGDTVATLAASPGVRHSSLPGGRAPDTRPWRRACRQSVLRAAHRRHPGLAVAVPLRLGSGCQRRRRCRVGTQPGCVYSGRPLRAGCTARDCRGCTERPMQRPGRGAHVPGARCQPAAAGGGFRTGMQHRDAVPEPIDARRPKHHAWPLPVRRAPCLGAGDARAGRGGAGGAA